MEIIFMSLEDRINNVPCLPYCPKMFSSYSVWEEIIHITLQTTFKTNFNRSREDCSNNNGYLGGNLENQVWGFMIIEMKRSPRYSQIVCAERPCPYEAELHKAPKKNFFLSAWFQSKNYNNETDLQSGKRVYPWRWHFFQTQLLSGASFVMLSNVISTVPRKKDTLLKSGTVIFALHSTKSWMFRAENKWLTPSRHPYRVVCTDITLSKMQACWRRLLEMTHSEILKGLPRNAMGRALQAMVCS